MGNVRTEGLKNEQGSGLIEVMIALLIMLFLMIGVLQMFSMAFLVNSGSAARTDMVYKCQQVTEQIRMVKYLRSSGLTVVNDPTTTVPATFSAKTVTLPASPSDPDFKYWGPSGANVLGEMSGSTYIAPAYLLSYTIADGSVSGATGFWIITVSAVPNLASVSNTKRYHGIGLNKKRIDYVAQIRK